MGKLLKKGLTAAAFFLVVSTAFSSDQQNVQILYPKDHSIVGNRVNLVLDPTEIPYFQIIVNKSEYPLIDTSRGMHAYQGLALEPGENAITVKVFAQTNPKDKDKIGIVASKSVTVFNRDGFFSSIPQEFSEDPFHTRERESSCGGCHRLEVTEQDIRHSKPGDVLCSACHREIPTGRQIHGPAAVWNCLSCHNPDLYPAKYAFSSVDPWKVVKSTQPVEPMLFTLSATELFKPGAAVLISKTRAKDMLGEALNYIKQNPADKIRLEVHTDNTPLTTGKPKKGKRKGAKDNKRAKDKGPKDNQALSTARAKALEALLREAGISKKRLLAIGMGAKLPKASNKTQEGRDLNNRIEIVVYPSDVKIINSQKLPVLKDRERVVVNVSYGHGPKIRKLRIVEQVPKGLLYSKGSGFIRGKFVEPKAAANELIWEFGDMEPESVDALFYVLKKSKGAKSVPLETKITYICDGRDQSREFDPKAPARQGLTVMETCLKCHQPVLENKFKHGPVDAGHCNLCHDPHSSPYPAWLRKPVWDLCTTCHLEQANGVHVVAGFNGSGHPTRGKRDPSRPGKRLSCASCHQPHGGESRNFLAYSAKTRLELCSYCHRKK